jgi:hypothetical protein
VERFPSGQREQTVNLSSDDFGGSNPPLSTILLIALAGVAQLARASAFQAEGRGFEPRFPLHFVVTIFGGEDQAQVAQSVEHILGKDEVTGSNPVLSSIFKVKLRDGRPVISSLYSE